MAARLSALSAGRFLLPGRFLAFISIRGWVVHRAMVQLEGLGKLKTCTSSGTRTGDIPACSTLPQPTMLPRAPDVLFTVSEELFAHGCRQLYPGLVHFLARNSSIMELVEVENRNTFCIVGNAHRKCCQIVTRDPRGTLLSCQCDS
jgi:hypothetical protein